LAFVPIVGAAITNNSFFYWLAGIAVPFLVWLVRPGRRDDGNPISPKEMPELYAAVDRLKKEIDVEGRLQIELSDEVQASVREVLGVFGLFGNRRLMTLGIPLLAILDKDEARAVIAHELGHFSRPARTFRPFLVLGALGLAGACRTNRRREHGDRPVWRQL